MADKLINNKQKTIAAKQGKAPAKNGGSKKKAGIAVIIVLLVATAIALSVMIVTKNLFGGRDVIVDFLTSMDASYETLQERNAALKEYEAALVSREESVVKKENDLAEEEAALEEKAADLQREKVNSSFELYIASLSEERIVQFQQLGTIYSNMEAEQAAAALSKVGSPIDMAIVIYYMKPEFSAGVLNCMDTKLAAQITESLLK